MLERPDTNSKIAELLDALLDSGGSDLLVTAGMPPQLRIHGELVSVAGRMPLTSHDTDAFLAELLTPAQAEAYGAQGEHDFSFSWRGQARVRASAFVQRGKIALALRMIPRQVPSLADLRMPNILTEFTRMHQGLVLVTGPTGSGKSTTLAAMIDQINRERACHIVTIEDPIEYMHDHDRSMINQREVGTDTASFSGALRAVLRSDPDVLLVGEMRDLESISTALTIAETGHLVFATLHTNDAAQTVSRITDVFPAQQQAQVRTQLAAALTGIVYQRLVPRIGGGMVAAHEVLVANVAVRNLIKDGKTHQLRNALLTGQKEGMITFEQSLSALVRTGVVTYEDAVVRSLHPGDVEAPQPARAGARV